MHESGTKVTLPNGKLWGVAGAAGWTVIKAVKYDAPHILIPTDELEGMSSEEIGASVLTMVTKARFCQALDYAETFLSDPGFDYLSGNTEELLKQIENAKEILIEFRGKDKRIDQSLSLINRYEEEQEARTRLKAHKETHRKIASANYEKLFFKLEKNTASSACRVVR